MCIRDSARAVSAGPDDVHRPNGSLHAKDALPHERSEAGKLLDRLAAHAERDEERGELGGRGFAVHHRAHSPVGLLAVERSAVDHDGEGGADGVAHETAPTAGDAAAVGAAGLAAAEGAAAGAA